MSPVEGQIFVFQVAAAAAAYVGRMHKELPKQNVSNERQDVAEDKSEDNPKLFDEDESPLDAREVQDLMKLIKSERRKLSEARNQSEVPGT